MLKFIKTENANSDFIQMVNLLDEDLKVTDGDEHDFYNQFNGVENINHCIVIYNNEEAIGCGAIKTFDKSTMEIKRMFIKKTFRGQGIATKALIQLEQWAKELGYERCILETGSRQHSAIALYKKNNYKVIENYAQYIGVENSICFEKLLLEI